MPPITDHDDDKDDDLPPSNVNGHDHEADDKDDGAFEDVFIPDEEDDGKEGQEAAAGGDDERLGADAEGDAEAQRREQRRKERKAKRAKKKMLDQHDRLELNYLRQQNEELERRLLSLESNVDKRLRNNDVQRLKGAYGQLQSKLAEANELMAAAMAANNPEDVTKALDVRDQIRDKMARIQVVLSDSAAAQGEELNGDARGGRQLQGPDKAEIIRVAQRNAQVFRSKHEWFDGRNNDSVVALGIDAQLRAEGLNPAQAAFWTELEERLAKRLPHRFNASASTEGDDEDDDEDDERDDPPRGQAKQTKQGKQSGRRGPPVAVPSTQGGRKGVTYTISRARREALQAAGMWDDPKLRAKMVKRYAEYDKQRADGDRR